MRFTQIEFIILIITMVLVLSQVRSRRIRHALILLGNYYFYAYWDYRFLGLILVPTLLDFCVAKRIDKLKHSGARRALLIISLLVNLGILGFFKYFNFFLSSFKSLPMVSDLDSHTWDIILPLGISFYTFRVISYTIDVYQNRLKPCNQLLDFALYVSFFPIMTSGPIVRASAFLPQLKTSTVSLKRFYSGYRYFVIGLFQKAFVADNVAMFVNHFYDNHAAFNTSTCWLAIIAYTIQIYCDFAGYSNMAIGIACCLGFDIEKNFNFPYLSTSISEFWCRWHISLSSWIKDYIYIPLGGNRRGRRRTYANLIIAMTLCGLWHGASWLFVLWGFFHGIILVLSHSMRSFITNRIKSPACILSFLGWVFTFTIVTFGWIYFRSSSFAQATSIQTQLLSIKSGISWYPPFVVFIIIATGIIHVLKRMEVKLIDLPIESKYTPTVLFCLIWLVIIYYPKGFQPFVYAQF
jgi:alginate O-acetyltransferase complex protein AlgI